MFRTKKDVDKHVSDIFSKQKNEYERSLKGYNIARLYFEVKSYEMAQRHLASFLSLKDEHSAGHKLMGQISEATGNSERALQCYKRSLDLDPNQKDVILKVCELYCQLPVDPDTARYWADRAEKLFPHNKTVFKLRECIVNAEGEPNLKELENLISSELNARPRDVMLYIKMLKLYMDTERIDQAFNFSLKVEEKQLFPHSVDWYYCLSDICEAYQEELGPQLKIEFCIHYALVLNHLVTLLLAEPHFLPPDSNETPSKHGRSVADAASVLQTFDQFLLKLSQLPLSKEGPFKYVFHHAKGQLYLHLACLLLKRAKKDQGNWKEACRYSAALLLVAYTLKSDNLYQEVWFNKIENKKPYQLVHQHGILRLSYAGHILNSLCKDEKNKFLQRMKNETCIPQVRDKIFQRAFSLLGKQAVSNQSYFLHDSAFVESTLEFPSAGSLQEYDKVAHKVYPDSLHHLVWLILHRKSENKNKNPPKFQVFEKLQYSSDVLNNGSPESLCQLDTEAFLIAAVFTTENAMEKRRNMMQRSDDSVLFFPPHIGDPLCTEEQTLWWRTAYSLYSNTSKEKMSELRLILRRGLEVIRGVGNHGLDVSLVIELARHFADQALIIRKRLGEDDQLEEVVALEERAVHYWTIALSLLNKVVTNRRLQQPKERLFGIGGKEPSSQEISELREEGRFYIACHNMNIGCLEAAAEEFSKLSLPYAAYNEAKVLKKLAAQCDDKQKKTALLTKAKEALYSTMDRIAGDRKHPLNLTLQEEIEALEMELTETQRPISLDYDDDRTEEDEPSVINGSPQRRLNVSNGSYEIYSTPRNSPSKNANNTSLTETPSARHVRPSPERLDCQIRALAFTQENLIKTLVELRSGSVEQQNAMLESNKAILSELKDMKKDVEGLKKQFEDFQKAKCQHCSRSRGPHLKSTTEEELDEEEEDNGYEDNLYDYSHVEVDNGYSYNAYGHGVLHGPQRGASNMGYNYQGPPQPPMMLHYPHHQYPPGAPMGQPPMGPMDISQRPRNYYPHFPPPAPGLPFSEGQQLPQFNFRMPPPNQGVIPPATHPIAPPQTRPFPSQDAQTSVTQTQQATASPNQSNKEPISAPTSEPSSTWNQNAANNAPHAFQIPLPPSVGSSGASNQPPAILSTPNFVASPFGSSQLASQSSHSSPLKTALTTTPNTSLFGSTGNWPSPSAAVSNKSPKKQDSSYEHASGNESEEETGGYFKPLIPLPAEIDVKTGEENEKVLFEERAKLFRYTEKEWKERGVGVIKLLLNEALDRVRLVMRRDQVLKICANHYIKSDMELKPMKDNDKAWIWIAEDFADEEVKAEQFCIRFKTAEIAKSFKTAFDDAKKRDGSASKDDVKDEIKEATPPPLKTVIDKSVAKESNKKSEEAPQSGFGSKFKPPAGSWSCDSCYLVNSEDKQACIACEKPKPGATPKPSSSFKFGATNPVLSSTPVAKDGFGDKFKPASGSWTCEACYLTNAADKMACLACEQPKPGATKVEVASNPTALKFGFKPASAQPTTPNAFGGVDLSSSSSSGFIKSSDHIVKPKPMEFKFGIPASLPSSTPANDVSSTTGLDLISATKPTSQTNKTVLGGFTFTAPPKIIPDATKKENKPDVSKETTKPSEPKKESPFAGFQFTPPKLTTEPTTNIFGGSGPFSGSSSFKPPTTQPSHTFGGVAAFGSTLSSNPLTSQASHVFGTTTTFGTGFPSTPPTLTFGNLSTTQSPKVGTDSAFKSVVTSKTSAFTPTSESPNTSKEVPEEFEPSVDFAPVVPLPELVEVKTGEEDEEVLFNERAKLFRFDPVTKEWKERGIGNAKILKNKDTGKFRVLMRREQVLKLCANHYILPEMALTVMNNSNKAWTWFAQDFSEGEVKTENLAIRFKTVDLALNFKKVFDKCCKESKDEVQSVKDIPSSTTTDTALKPLSEAFKPKVGSWECKECYVRNEAKDATCLSCGTSKDSSSTTLAPSQTTSTFTFTLPQKFKVFECSACYKDNTKDSPNCEFCGCPKPQKPTEKTEQDSSNNPTAFKFGIPSTNAPNNPVFGQKEYTFGNIKSTTSSNFAFGSNAGNTETQDSSVKSIFGTTPSGPFSNAMKLSGNASQSSIEFRFGSPQKFEFNFTGPRARSPSKGPKSPGTPNDSINYGTEDEGEVSSDADNIFFQPVIPLPPKVDVKTGEEDELAVYSQRAKLYRFDGGEWKERGTGDIKVLWNEKDNKARLLMRREQVLKTCLNHCLSKDVKLQRKNEKTWMWAASDFSEGEAKLEKFAIRFKSPEVADQFEKIVEEYKNKVISPTKPASTEIETTEKPTTSAVKRLDFSDLAQKLNEKEATSTTSVIQPNANSETKPSSASTFSFKMNTSSTPKATGAFGLASRFGVESPQSGSFTFGGSPKVTDSKFVISDISVVEEKKATAEQKEMAEKLQLPSNFYLYEKKEPCKGCRGCLECDKEVEVVFERVPTEEQLSKAALLQLPPSFFFYDEKPPCPGCRGCSDGEETKTAEKPVIQESTIPPKEPEPASTAPETNLFKLPATTLTPKEDNSSASESLFGSFSMAGGFSFEALASQKADNLTPFKSTTKNIFEGAGTPLFGAKTIASRAVGAHDDEVAPSPEVHFEPVVPLPELIEVKTGEEEEMPVFNERAKLYRFDKDTSQWKERGVGQFKILKHNSKCQYRLLLRREQVHKVACNHYITPEVELNKMTNSDNSLCWTAMDFTEGTLISELFAIRFKTKDILAQFKIKFDECRQDVCENAVNTSSETVSVEAEPENESVLTQEEKIEENSKPIIEEPEETQNTVNSEEYQEDEDDQEIMFQKRVTLSERLNNTNEYKSIGMGTLQIMYDDSIFGARIQMVNDNEEILCNHFIALQTCLRTKDCEAFWTAIDMSVDPPKRRQFKASFSSKNAVEEFEKVFEEGKSMAVEAEIVERDDPPIRN